MKKNGKSKTDDRHSLFARIPKASFEKLQKLASKRTGDSGKRVTMQDVVVELIREARV